MRGKGKETKMMMSNLPTDMVEEVLSRVPMTSLKRVRSTCKYWNTLSKNWSFVKKHLQARLGFTVVLMMNFRVYLMSVNLHNSNVESCMKREGTLIRPDNLYQIYISQVFHCDGLLLCISKDCTKVVVWNPYLGQTRWIEPTGGLESYTYALGYEKNSKSHKILRFIQYSGPVELKIYDLNSYSWRVLDVNPDWHIGRYHRGVSLKGNTYWLATEMHAAENDNYFLLCFDFTRERFGPRLPLPLLSKRFPKNRLSLSSVREEQLAVLIQRTKTLQIEIWVTTKIEPNTVSWSSKAFLTVNMMRRLTSYNSYFIGASFFIDEEKEVAVVVSDNNEGSTYPTDDIAYIVGVNGSLKEVDIGESPCNNWCFPHVCSYVPSLAQLN